ncbi:helix-turn-helix domain-containing protein [Sporanaerobium hydrogeniformans]|uniref:helix-turn-helix domain-containing protein n=1 Tax=Sporanaerobium hydrogeniformans TaxID=3072179 RepID=UPI0015D51E11|nr:helix-turn-helix domain-containing protein [Sporanaerobium hydrogeniformans]
MQEIHKRIKLEREEHNLTQEELGTKLGIGRSAISNWESGRKTPDGKTLDSLANIFNCSIDYLWGRTNVKNAHVINRQINGNNVKIEIDEDYFKKCTPSDIKQILDDIQSAGFDVKKFIDS